MNEILHANIFFVIASVATVIFSILLCIILYQLYKVIRTLRRIIEKVEAGSEKISADFAQVRSAVENGGMVSKLFAFVVGAATNRRSRRGHKED